MKPDILNSPSGKVFLADGAIGTELQRRGLDLGSIGESWNVEKPEAVQSIHRDYFEAGACLLTTNSFRANRFSLKHHRLDSRVQELNRQAAALARAAVGEDALVLGSVGPFGDFLTPLGTTDPADAQAWFLEQARALLEGGADGIVVETMAALDEAELAIRAAREAGAPIVVGLMTFNKSKGGYRTMMGATPLQCAKAALDAGADIIGSNCGVELSIQDYAEIVRQLRSCTTKPIEIRPNAGQPELTETGVVYKQAAEIMAQEVMELFTAGANIIGGCCGTTPEHIRHFHSRFAAAGILA